MGAWGSLPWDNDGAADWFGNLFEKSNLSKSVEKALKLDADECHEEIRAAAAIVLLFCHNYVWPVDDIDGHLEMAVTRLEELSRLDLYQEDPDVLAKIQAEIDVLKARIQSPDTIPHPKWWCY